MTRIAGVIHSEAKNLTRTIVPLLAAGAAVAVKQIAILEPTPSCAIASMVFRAEPITYDAEDISVVIDGSIFNSAELGRCRNHAELIAVLFRREGFPNLLTRLNGDFGIALFDKKENTLWLGRDRLGVKPIYYTAGLNLFAFASRPRPLLALPGVGYSINIKFAALFAVSHYRYFDNAPEDSPYERVDQLPAAHWLSYRNGKVKIGKYWQLQDLPNWTDSESELAQKYKELLLNAVNIRVEGALRPAFTLSGGMDSSSVLACAARSTGVARDAFSTVYADKTYDESEEICAMLAQSVSNWHPVSVDDPDVFSLVRTMIDVNDEPIATATWLSHFILCSSVAEKGFGSLFGGLGGDELNAGEYEHFFPHFADIALIGRGEEYNQEIDCWAENHDHPIHRKNRAVAVEMITRGTDSENHGICKPDYLRMRRYYSALNPEFFKIDTFEPVMESPFTSYLKTRTYQDLTRETAPCCLRAEDRQTQAFALENYLPFFDHRLVEFMFRVPGSMKIREGITKVLLREAMKGILPEETRTRIKKTGWNAPAHIWFSGKGREELFDLLHTREFRERGIYNHGEVLRLANDHEQIVSTGQMSENHMMFFWQLVNLETWIQSINHWVKK